MEPALEKLNRLESEFPSAEIMDMAYNLKGNVLQDRGAVRRGRGATTSRPSSSPSGARTGSSPARRSTTWSPCSAQRSAARRTNPRDQGRGARTPTSSGRNIGIDSPYKAQVAVARHPRARPWSAAARRPSSACSGVIAEMAQIQGAFGLEEAINSYTEGLPQQAHARAAQGPLLQVPGDRRRQPAAQALLRIAIIGVFEDKSKKGGKDEERGGAAQANAMIKVLFEDLKNDFEPKNLSNYILVRVGRLPAREDLRAAPGPALLRGGRRPPGPVLPLPGPLRPAPTSTGARITGRRTTRPSRGSSASTPTPRRRPSGKRPSTRSSRSSAGRAIGPRSRPGRRNTSTPTASGSSRLGPPSSWPSPTTTRP